MIVVDTNILIHAHRAESSKHEQAVKALTILAEGSRRWAIPIFCCGEFLRIISHPKLFNPPHTPQEAIDALKIVLSSPSVVALKPSDSYENFLYDTISKSSIKGNLIFDALIAALCEEHGIRTILTEDNDFKKFKYLHVLSLDHFLTQPNS